ncbi:hypothetical protein BRLA_c008760 [Brevibacillus laterosporus LMG 15441]|uniref:Uncharacterized protein n=1 Tax=Brevibacillus laterosporus LMG 15441 TaxID=1042163 RepID=A0A075QXY7_BRELA|nr:hypothetical protein BRLA_c008760 [Brevibacillus laterosporus LMG 15441]
MQAHRKKYLINQDECFVKNESISIRYGDGVIQ